MTQTGGSESYLDSFPTKVLKSGISGDQRLQLSVITPLPNPLFYKTVLVERNSEILRNGIQT